MFTSTHIANIEIFAFIAVAVFNLLSHKVLFINNKKTIETVKKQATFLKNQQTSWVNYCKMMNS